MSAIALVAAATADRKINIVESIQQHPLVSGAALTAGDPVYYGTDGRLLKALADTAPHANVVGVCTRTVAGAGEAITVLQKGKLDGFDLSALAYGDPVYLQDTGGIGTTAGTVSKIIGRVFSAHANLLGSSPAKILQVEL